MSCKFCDSPRCTRPKCPSCLTWQCSHEIWRCRWCPQDICAACYHVHTRAHPTEAEQSAHPT